MSTEPPHTRSNGSNPSGKIKRTRKTVRFFRGEKQGGILGAVTGGFWAHLVASPVPDDPRLTLVRFHNGDISLQWPGEAAGLQMESSTNLTQWIDIGGEITHSGVLTLQYNPAIPKRFFRLRYP